MTIIHTKQSYQIFKILIQVFSEKSLTEKFPDALHRSERWEQGKRKKKSKIITSILIFFNNTQYTWPSTRCIQNLRTLAQIETKISVIKNCQRERKML